jgi:AbiU2
MLTKAEVNDNMPNQRSEIRRLRTRFNVLACQLGFANTHLHYFLRLEESRKNCAPAFLESYDFWQFTKQAHLEIATFYLCRTYDKNPSGDHLYRFLNEIPRGGLSEEKKEVLQADLDFCHQKSKAPAIGRLRNWRDNFGAHFNYRLTAYDGRETLSTLKSKALKTPSVAELQQLINKGFEILERKRLFVCLAMLA